MRYSILLICILLLGCSGNDDTSCTSFTPQASDQYAFPIRPGMPEWSELTTGQAKVDVLQVPEEILLKMSTYGLVETSLDYPLLATMLVFNNIQEGTEAQIENFNGLTELTKRSDAALLMLRRFQQMDSSCPPDGQNMGDYSLFFVYMGMLQAQNVFIEQLTSDERRELLEEALKKYSEFEKPGDTYSISNLETLGFIMARVMILENYGPFLAEMEGNNSITIFLEGIKSGLLLENLAIIRSYANQY